MGDVRFRNEGIFTGSVITFGTSTVGGGSGSAGRTLRLDVQAESIVILANESTVSFVSLLSFCFIFFFLIPQSFQVLGESIALSLLVQSFVGFSCALTSSQLSIIYVPAERGQG